MIIGDRHVDKTLVLIFVINLPLSHLFFLSLFVLPLVIHVVGNKLDLAATKRVVPIERTEEYVARTLGTEFSVHEVSAKDDDGKSTGTFATFFPSILRST